MAIENSHGKARPTLPRPSDLGERVVAGTDAERRRNHDASGRFTNRNNASGDRGWRRALKKLVASDLPTEDVVVRTVLQDAWRIFSATMRELPNDGPTVRGLALRMARHSALESFWTTRAASLGLVSTEAMAAEDRATKHGQRAERVAVTMLDVASALAKAAPTPNGALPIGYEFTDEPEEPK